MKLPEPWKISSHETDTKKGVWRDNGEDGMVDVEVRDEQQEALGVSLGKSRRVSITVYGDVSLEIVAFTLHRAGVIPDCMFRLHQTCEHEWVSGDNEVVSGSEVCTKCKEIRTAPGGDDG